MGWDYTHATHYTRTGAIDKKAEIDELYTWQNDTKKGGRDAERTLKQRKIRTH